VCRHDYRIPFLPRASNDLPRLLLLNSGPREQRSVRQRLMAGLAFELATVLFTCGPPHPQLRLVQQNVRRRLEIPGKKLGSRQARH